MEQCINCQEENNTGNYGNYICKKCGTYQYIKKLREKFAKTKNNDKIRNMEKTEKRVGKSTTVKRLNETVKQLIITKLITEEELKELKKVQEAINKRYLAID